MAWSCRYSRADTVLYWVPSVEVSSYVSTVHSLALQPWRVFGIPGLFVLLMYRLKKRKRKRKKRIIWKNIAFSKLGRQLPREWSRVIGNKRETRWRIFFSCRRYSRLPHRLGEDEDAEPENRLVGWGADVPEQLWLPPKGWNRKVSLRYTVCIVNYEVGVLRLTGDPARGLLRPLPGPGASIDGRSTGKGHQADRQRFRQR